MQRFFFSSLKIENFNKNNYDIFSIFAQNIDCVYTLEPPCRDGFNEYPQSMFWSKNKKALLYKIGYNEVYISRTCFPDAHNFPVYYARRALTRYGKNPRDY